MKSSDASPPGLARANPRQLAAHMRGVCRYFDNPGFIRALMNVSLDVRQGEVLALLGAAGSGKSTLLRILAGRLAPSEGDARVFGRSPRRGSSKARVGYLPQRPAQDRSQFLVEFVGFFKDLVSSKKKASAQEPPAEIAGAIRLAMLKKILARRPDLVLLDEPFAGLDEAGSAEMKDFIRALASQGRSVLFTGSSLLDTKDICDRVGVLYRGQLEAIGSLEEFLAAPRNLRYLADFLPQPTAERLLHIIRQELDHAPELVSAGGADSGAADAIEANSNPVDAKLASLQKPSDVQPAKTEKRDSQVDHALLAALTKPSETAPPSEDRKA